MSNRIGEEQTAYIPGRLINDNVRAMLMTIDQADYDRSVDGVLVSLDAKKAFDSVDHRFIKRCLASFGLQNFVPIFETLYKGLHSTILLNGKTISGYKILKGVKQGDALSCILFIMCMEPLIRNIKSNQEIVPIVSSHLDISIPKVYSFADDVSVATKKDENCVKEIFREYELFSKESGLVLNANKTEILRFNHNRSWNYEIDINYIGVSHKLVALQMIKINGIWMLQDSQRREETNVRKCTDSMDRLLAVWSTRHLSLLGRILIIKTFAISQLIYLMQSMTLNEESFKNVDKVVFKYLWNKNYHANRAPERLKRSIMLTSAKNGGFGLIKAKDLGDSLDLRSYGRLMNSNHPFFKQLRPEINANNFFNVSIKLAGVDAKLSRAIKLLNVERKKILDWPSDIICSNASIISVLQAMRLSELLTDTGKRSLMYFAIHTRVLHPRVHQINAAELRAVARFISDLRIRRLIGDIIGAPRVTEMASMAEEAFPIKVNVVKRISTLSSKSIRIACTGDELDMVNVFKLGPILTPGELRSWTGKLKKLTSTRHKNILLRAAHGDIFSNSRLFKFGLRGSSACANCLEQIESIQHRIKDCPKVGEAWRLLNEAKVALDMAPLTNLSMENLLGMKDNLGKLELALNAELILKVTSKSDGYDAKLIVRSVIKTISNAEKLNEAQKETFKAYVSNQ